MAYERKDNEGSLWVEENRRDDKSRHYRGDQLLVCPHCQAQIDLWMSGWKNKTQAGQPYIKIKLSPKEARTEQRRATAPPQRGETADRGFNVDDFV